jgi:formamidopyrimidine-DNA glycosylase
MFEVVSIIFKHTFMPELPEVETVRQDLRKKLLGKKITQLEILKTKLSKKEAVEFENNVKSSSFQEIERYGKLLVFVLQKSQQYMLVHLKMTGQLVYQLHEKIIMGGHSFATHESVLPGKHTRVIFTFADQSNLFFNDMRGFGYIKLVSVKELEKIISRFGIEPLKDTFTLSNFSKIIRTKKMKLKALLLNQALIAGIGNIYADEICFGASVLPERSTVSLTTEEIEKLYSYTDKILRKAVVLRGTTFNNYVDGDGKKGNFLECLQVYGRKGKICLRCRDENVVIKKKKIVGRGTHFCEGCQF